MGKFLARDRRYEGEHVSSGTEKHVSHAIYLVCYTQPMCSPSPRNLPTTSKLLTPDQKTSFLRPPVGSGSGQRDEVRRAVPAGRSRHHKLGVHYQCRCVCDLALLARQGAAKSGAHPPLLLPPPTSAPLHPASTSYPKLCASQRPFLMAWVRRATARMLIEMTKRKTSQSRLT